MKVSIIGAGKLGGALAIALAKKQYIIENLAARSAENAERISALLDPKPQILPALQLQNISSDIIFITTQDSEIASAAENLAGNLQNQSFLFHTSGSLSSGILQNLKNKNYFIGSIHPLISISDSILGAERFKDAYFCVEGDAEAVKSAEKIVKDLGGKSFSVSPEFKTLYHAAAVTACGHLVALFDAAIEMLSKCGLNEPDAKKILLPLVESAFENLKTQTTSEALTGTFARADASGFELHLASLRQNVSDEILDIYLQLALRSLHLAETQGASRQNLEKIRQGIMLAKRNLK